MHFRLKEHAERYGIEFLSSPFSVERARFLCEKLGLTKIKIASSQMLCLPMLDYVNEHADTVFLSTGMATLEEVREAARHLKRVRSLYILQCTTQYPTLPADANLAVIGTLQKEFPNCGIGYSDHTCGILAPIVAVALGAQVIEKHFTLDKTLPGTDHVLSAEPAELKAMIRQIREVELLLGSAVKKPIPQEREIVSMVRSRFAKVPA
jgi:sialic acid synthase SpsE